MESDDISPQISVEGGVPKFAEHARDNRWEEEVEEEHCRHEISGSSPVSLDS